MPLPNLLTLMDRGWENPVFLAQIEGSPSKGSLKFCGPFTDCPDNAPLWLPVVLLAAFVALVFVLSARSKSKRKGRALMRGPKPSRPFEAQGESRKPEDE